MKKLLIKSKIVQAVSNEQRHKDGLKRLGKGCFEAYRLNPFNPISYVLAVLAIPIIIILYGFVGLFEKFINPFKWN